jgi:hypothetical protein
MKDGPGPGDFRRGRVAAIKSICDMRDKLKIEPLARNDTLGKALRRPDRARNRMTEGRMTADPSQPVLR